MAFFEVTSRELRNKAENLRGLNGQFRAKCNELDSQEQELCSMWEGQAKETFHHAFARDKEQMLLFEKLIERYVEVMLEIAARYEEAEARNAEIASSRSY